mmetsp:Transcript_76356/g.205327  ORF Transcript_76356/g.205327 Transcript_76356/m.205327 type:complete len:131 (+) Transcript_76356:414-806(+)
MSTCRGGSFRTAHSTGSVNDGGARRFLDALRRRGTFDAHDIARSMLALNFGFLFSSFSFGVFFFFLWRVVRFGPKNPLLFLSFRKHPDSASLGGIFWRRSLEARLDHRCALARPPDALASRRPGWWARAR